MTPVLNNYSIDQMASSVQKVERDNRFAGRVFAGTAFAILALAAFLLLTDSIAKTPWKMLVLLGIPIVYFYIAGLYFRAVRKTDSPDWTLAARTRSEKEKLARQVALARKSPTHIFMPIYLIVLLAFLPGLLGGPSGEIPLLPSVMLGGLAMVLVAAAWVVKRSIRIQLQPMLDKITALEEELNQP